MSKDHLRLHFKKIRTYIPESRRSFSALAFLDKWFNEKDLVLSYASFGCELDTFPLNMCLAAKKSLVLPKRDGNQLKLIKVDSIPKTAYLYEPDEGEEICPSKIQKAFIPALAFDSAGHRLGYGKGHYDRLLPKLNQAKLYGVGFKEQFFEGLLPVEPHDQAVQFLELY